MEPATLTPTQGARPRLALYVEPDAAPSNRFGRGSRLSADAKLRVMFQDWYTPIVFRGDGDADEKTIYETAKSVDYWEQITGDPNINEIDAWHLAEFKAGLRVVTWSRGGPLAPRYPLAPHTQTKHLKNIRSLLERCGPTIDRETPCADLVDYMPHMRIKSPKRLLPGPVPTLEQVRAVFREAGRIRDPLERNQWLARLSVLHYCGLRIGTAQALDAAMLRTIYGRRWLAIDGDDVKTGNALAVPLHTEAAAALDRLCVIRGPLFPPAEYDAIRYRFDKLQRAAGIVEPFGFHSARRFHAEQLNEIGADHGDLASQASLDHASGRTTQEFYSRARALLIERFPKLYFEADATGQVRLL